jgi:hypothetical protein
VLAAGQSYSCCTGVSVLAAGRRCTFFTSGVVIATGMELYLLRGVETRGYIAEQCSSTTQCILEYSHEKRYTEKVQLSAL